MNFIKLKDCMDRLTEWRIPGCSVRIYKGGEEVYRYASGFENVEKKIPMTGDEFLNMYSCSKIVTAVAAMQLLEKGIFLLDDPLYHFIPEFRDMYVKTENGDVVKAERPITMRDLFTMSAGFSYALDTPGIKKAHEITNGKMDTLIVAKCMAEDILDFQPGTRWAYSMCHDLLAAAVEAISGQKFGEYVKENIFGPLGVTELTYNRDEKTKEKIAQQYEFVFEEEKREGENLIPAGSGDGYWRNIGKNVGYQLGENYESGGAGLVIRSEDYAKFGVALANFGKGSNGERILSKGSVNLMRQDQMAPRNIAGFTWPHLAGYGYGLGVRTMVNIANGGTVGNAGEFGWDGAAGSLAVIDPDNEIFIFYAQHMMNSQGPIVKARIRNVAYGCLDD